MARKPREQTVANQDAFLTAYAGIGSLRSVCESLGLNRKTVLSWNHSDTYGFKERYVQAKEEFREYLQDLAIRRVRDQKPNDNPVLLITLLNAHWPEKYRRDSNAASGEVKEMMGEWKKWVKENGKKSIKSKEVSEGEEARRNAVDEVEKILASRQNSDDAG